MIRVLHYGIGPNRGGIESSIFKVASHIDRSRFTFDFLYTAGSQPCFYDDLVAMGCRFFPISRRRTNPLRNVADVRLVLARYNFDIVHCHFNTLAYIEPAVEAHAVGVPVIVHSRNSGARRGGLTRILHRVNSLRLPVAGVTRLAVSEAAGRWLFQSQDFRVIRNGLDLERYRFSAERRRELRATLGLDERFVVGHVGAFQPQKNHRFLIDAFSRVKMQRPDAILLLVGGGPLRQHVDEQVKFHGIEGDVLVLENRSDVADLLSACDVFAFPSVFEGFGNALLEAQTSGLPCVVSEHIQPEVMVTELCTAIPLSAGVAAWADALTSVKPMVDRASAADTEGLRALSVDVEIEQVEALYSSLAARPTGDGITT